MKITPIPTPEPPPAFKPVTLQFTFETQEELDCFGTLFNHPRIVYGTFKGKEVSKILVSLHAPLRDAGSNLCSPWNDLTIRHP